MFEMPAFVAIVGLMTAFWVNLFVRSPAAPGWVVRMRDWGKPWSCKLCMSFWIGLAFTEIGSLVMPGVNPYVVNAVLPLPLAGLLALFILTSAVAMVSLAVVSWLEHIEPLILN